MNRRRLFIALLAALVAVPAHAARIEVAGGGPTVQGSGTAMDDVRAVSGFNALTVGGPMDVKMKAAAAERVVVHADDNIAPLIQTRVEQGRLVIDVAPGASFRTSTRMYVVVEFAQINGIVLNGSGDVHADRIEAALFDITVRGSGKAMIEQLNADVVAVSVNGSGDVVAAGKARAVGINIVGSGDVRADRLQAVEAAVRIRGSGDARVHATGTLQVDLSGSGDVRYRGEPALQVKRSGSGDVERIR